MEGIFIFVLDRGFVVVGEAELSKDLALHWHLPRSRTVRNWGTSQGLSELCDGPVEGKTVLDPVCERVTPFRSVLDMLVPTKKGLQRWLQKLSEPSGTGR